MEQRRKDREKNRDRKDKINQGEKKKKRFAAERIKKIDNQQESTEKHQC